MRLAVILAVPIIALLLIVQSAFVSRVPLLQGTADLLLLSLLAWALQPRVSSAWHWAFIGGVLIHLFSSLPVGVPMAGYVAATAVALGLRQRVWQTPFLAMLIATVIGTLISQGLSWLALRFGGTPLAFFQSFYLVVLPSTLLNLLLALPFYSLAGDLATWLYPIDVEI